MSRKLVGHPYWISAVFFFVGFSPGMWMPTLPSVLQELDYEQWIPWVYAGMPIGGIISPFFLGALSDGKVAANRLCGYVLLAGGVTMVVAFGALHLGVKIEVFIGLMFLNSLLSAPIWALTTQSALAFLSGREERFPYFRLHGTIGWLLAGIIGAYWLNADRSAFAGVIAGFLRFPAGVMCFLMPHCEPLAKKKRFSVLEMMGEGSRDLWKDHNTRALLISAFLLAIPMASFFMYCPLQMKALKVTHLPAWMSMAQWVEVPAMLTITWACAKMRFKWLIGVGLGVCVFRQAVFGFSAYYEVFWPMPMGLVTHGLTFAYFMTVAQIYMERRVPNELRGRAQGMLSLMFGGLGTLTGVFITGRVFKYVVDIDNNTGWPLFWGIMAVLSVFPTVYFLIKYKGNERAT